MLDSENGDQDEPPAKLEAVRDAHSTLEAGGAAAGRRQAVRREEKD